MVAGFVDGAMQLRARSPHHAAHIMAGRKRLGAEIARHRQHVAEFHALIAAHAGDRRFAAQIAVGKIVHHALREPAFVIEHVMGDADFLGHRCAS